MSERFSWAPRYPKEFAKNDNDHFVPSGIDARTWLGFEDRIRERRFRALLESIQVAIEVGDRTAALAALDEARQLRPDAKELPSAFARAMALPSDVGAAVATAYFWPRMFSAVALMMVGVSLQIGLDWLQTSSLPALPPSSASLQPLGALNIPSIEVAATIGQSNIPAIQVAATSGLPRVKPRRAAAPAVSNRPVSRKAGQVLPDRPALAAPAASEGTGTVGWRKVFKPTARFLTNTLPRFLGVRVVPASGEQAAGERSSI
jgi:hypothetical protein